MSIGYATVYDIDLASKNKYCSFYVVRDTETEKYHVFVVVSPGVNSNIKKGFIMSTHDNPEIAEFQKNKIERSHKSKHYLPHGCNGTGW